MLRREKTHVLRKSDTHLRYRSVPCSIFICSFHVVAAIHKTIIPPTTTTEESGVRGLDWGGGGGVGEGGGIGARRGDGEDGGR